MMERDVGASALCTCAGHSGAPRFVVLTGGPGAGKTAVLEAVSRQYCRHVGVLPEAASLLFRGGFPRERTPHGRAAVQRAVYHVQNELETVAREARRYALVLCDRGTLDGCAYWPHAPESYFAQLHTSQAAELARYHAVIHLRSPGSQHGYNHNNPVRIESAEEARLIDARLEQVWAGHPRRSIVDSHEDFLHKLTAVLRLIRAEIPACCAPGAEL
jgi:predicted ATPase